MKVEGINVNSASVPVVDRIAERRVEPRRPISHESGSTQQESHPDREHLREQVEQLNGIVRFFNRQIHFEIHEDTSRIMVAVVDRETNEVIREIPPEEVLDIVARIDQTVGLLLDQRI